MDEFDETEGSLRIRFNRERHVMRLACTACNAEVTIGIASVEAGVSAILEFGEKHEPCTRATH